MPSMHFRAGVVAVVTDSAGRLMAFERSDIRGQWQLPQGGIDVGEEPEAAVWRELLEETGLGRDEVSLVEEYEDWTVYEWPDRVRQSGKRLGQAQRWFTFLVHDDSIEPTPDQDEFVDWRWVERGWLIDQIVGVRRVAYARVLGR
ncbi:MAG: NUDIX domain-containing protein [Acidimicrobiia bacterium]|nr:NUDIX domain-containing protein [Acidimicrobiia bacterium]